MQRRKKIIYFLSLFVVYQRFYFYLNVFYIYEYFELYERVENVLWPVKPRPQFVRGIYLLVGKVPNFFSGCRSFFSVPPCSHYAPCRRETSHQNCVENRRNYRSTSVVALRDSQTPAAELSDDDHHFPAAEAASPTAGGRLSSLTFQPGRPADERYFLECEKGRGSRRTHETISS